jgi:hypothetical protein
MMAQRSTAGFLTLIVLFTVLLPVNAAPAAVPPPSPRDEFFIISSVDVTRARLVLKRPTEVTVLMQVPASTVIADEHGAVLHLANLRAGDTIYAVASAGPGGRLVATSIRRGAMTVAELHRRLLRF